ncbi:keratin-associated protein 4-9-like [Rhopilema esculentum]|uniref:keratin-associated protein 4-9-like n=1 Tax=Rhopilema esculentum TaxID=499914 RepID=UPI0031DA2482
MRFLPCARLKVAKMKSMLIIPSVLILLIQHSTAAIVQNCTSNVCDLQTCRNTSSTCTQYCYSRNCKMSCSSSAGCESNCVNGGCSKLSCQQPTLDSRTSQCMQKCKEDCPDMSCLANACHLRCQKKNCKMTCEGKGIQSQCYPRCFGGGCEINVKSFYAEINCDEGFCKVKCGKATSNAGVICGKGSCSLTCTKGNTCSFQGRCPNCTGPIYVDDPFQSRSAPGNRALSFLSLISFCALRSLIL